MTDREAFSVVLRHCVGPRVHKKVAESVGLNSTAFSQYVKARRFPRRENFRKCCKAAGFSEPIFKGAMARIQLVASAGGDRAAQVRELERYLASAGAESGAEPLACVEDPPTQNLLEGLRRKALEHARDTVKTLEELSSRLAVILPGGNP